MFLNNLDEVLIVESLDDIMHRWHLWDVATRAEQSLTKREQDRLKEGMKVDELPVLDGDGVPLDESPIDDQLKLKAVSFTCRMIDKAIKKGINGAGVLIDEHEHKINNQFLNRKLNWLLDKINAGKVRPNYETKLTPEKVVEYWEKMAEPKSADTIDLEEFSKQVSMMMMKLLVANTDTDEE